MAVSNLKCFDFIQPPYPLCPLTGPAPGSGAVPGFSPRLGKSVVLTRPSMHSLRGRVRCRLQNRTSGGRPPAHRRSSPTPCSVLRQIKRCGALHRVAVCDLCSSGPWPPHPAPLTSPLLSPALDGAAAERHPESGRPFGRIACDREREDSKC